MVKLDTNTDDFRAGVRAWLEAHFPPSLEGMSAPNNVEGPDESAAEVVAWTKAMGEKGWGVPTWPIQYGGGGLGETEVRLLQQEMTRIGAWNPIGGVGPGMLGPTLLEYGNEEQKLFHLPRIARQEVRWCQGFSEPGAGSDLASLSTRADDMGDYFLVNGSKTWTSGGQWADLCFCLVRTDRARKQDGISFLLIDMHDPGVEVQPIRLIAGASPFCATFFTDVRVPKANLVGPLNGGWTIAKRLLQHERNGQSGRAGGAVLGVTGSVAETAKVYLGVDEHDQIADPDLRARIARLEMDSRAFQLTAARLMAESRSQGGPGRLQGPSTVTSILKNAGTQVGQDRDELIIEIMGYRGLGWEGEDFTEREIEAVRAWLRGKATTIFGGSAEIQNNIIAKRILGLPDPVSASSR